MDLKKCEIDSSPVPAPGSRGCRAAALSAVPWLSSLVRSVSPWPGAGIRSRGCQQFRARPVPWLSSPAPGSRGSARPLLLAARSRLVRFRSHSSPAPIPFRSPWLSRPGRARLIRSGPSVCARAGVPCPCLPASRARVSSWHNKREPGACSSPGSRP